MTRLRTVIVASIVAGVIGAPPLMAQALSKYRGYALGSSLGSVVKISGSHQSDSRTLHEQPAKIQEIAWRPPYVSSTTAKSDPVRDVLFSFYNDQLYRIVITYDRDRTEGLTDDDVVQSISGAYGPPLIPHVKHAFSPLPTGSFGETMVVAQWEDAASLLTLTREVAWPQFQLVLISKRLDPLALVAIKEALRLEKQEAPQRELDQRRNKAAQAAVVIEKARIANKAAFRP
jgi:hypothetical protein